MFWIPKKNPNLLQDHLGHHVTSMHINGTDGHDVLTVSLGEVTQQHGDEVVELLDLLLVVVLEGVLVAFFQPTKRHVDFCGPPDLGACQRHLRDRRELLVAIRQAFVFNICIFYDFI